MWILRANGIFLVAILLPAYPLWRRECHVLGREQSPSQARAGRERKMVSSPPLIEGGDNQEHRPTLPSDQPNDRLFADRPRKRERKEIAHWSAGASATNYADLCPHCPLSLYWERFSGAPDHSMEATGRPIRLGSAVGRREGARLRRERRGDDERR